MPFFLALALLLRGRRQHFPACSVALVATYLIDGKDIRFRLDRMTVKGSTVTTQRRTDQTGRGHMISQYDALVSMESRLAT